MRKPGEWIATIGAGMEVSRVVVEASEPLDLVGVWITDREGNADHVHYFDRVEAARLRAELGAALDRLEAAAIDAEPAVQRYAAVSCLGGYRIFDTRRGRVLDEHVFPSPAAAYEAVKWWNRLEASRTGEQSQAGTPPRA